MLVLLVLLLLLPLLLVVPLLLRPPLLPPLPCMRRAVRYYIVFMCHSSCLSAHAHEHAHDSHSFTQVLGFFTVASSLVPLAMPSAMPPAVPPSTATSWQWTSRPTPPTP